MTKGVPLCTNHSGCRAGLRQNRASSVQGREGAEHGRARGRCKKAGQGMQQTSLMLNECLPPSH